MNKINILMEIKQVRIRATITGFIQGLCVFTFLLSLTSGNITIITWIGCAAALLFMLVSNIFDDWCSYEYGDSIFIGSETK